MVGFWLACLWLGLFCSPFARALLHLITGVVSLGLAITGYPAIMSSILIIASSYSLSFAFSFSACDFAFSFSEGG